MNITCLTKTIIPAYSNVRFMILTDMSVFSDNLLLSTYSSKDHFKIIGIPLKAKTNSYGYCEIEDNEASELTLKMLKEQIKDFSPVEESLKENPDFTIWMCLKEKDLSWLGCDFESSSASFKEKTSTIVESLKVFSERDLLRLDKMMEMSAKPELSNKEKENLRTILENELRSTLLEIKLEDLSHSFQTYFSSHRILSKASSVGLIYYAFESYYALSVLDSEGYYLIPFKTVSDMTTQTAFTKLLLKDQIKDNKKESSDDIIPDINYEYSMSLIQLEKEFIDGYGKERSDDLLKGLEVGKIIDISDDSDLSDTLYDGLTSYVKFIKIESGE